MWWVYVLGRWKYPRTRKTQVNGVGGRRQWGQARNSRSGKSLSQWSVLGETSVTHDVTVVQAGGGATLIQTGGTGVHLPGQT